MFESLQVGWVVSDSMMSREHSFAWLKVAEDTAREAGRFLAQASSRSRAIEIDSRRDSKIRADKESEQIILSVLSAQSDFSILTEERGFLNRSSILQKGEPIWIVDPLDGSVNYSREIPLCCVSIGLWSQNKPILGAVYDFQRKELFSGIAGEAAWLNGERIIFSEVGRREDAILCTGFPVNSDFSPESLMGFVKQIREFKKVRLIGSAALSLAYVACGRVDAYMESDIMLWDVAAGLALVAGTGGYNYIALGRQKMAYKVYAANSDLGKLHEKEMGALLFES